MKEKIKRRSEKLDKFCTELLQLQELEDELKATGYQMSLGGESQRFKYTTTESKIMLERLQELPALIAELKAELEELQAKLTQQQSDRKSVRKFNRRQYQEVEQSLRDQIDALPNQWLVPFLEVWSGTSRGALRIDGFGRLTVTVLNNRHNLILNSIKTRYYLDATATPQMLALYRQIPVSQILWIQQEQPAVDNLDFIWVTGMGLAGKNRSESCDERIKVLHTPLKEKHPDLATFDWKNKKNVLEAHGHYFSDSTRGFSRSMPVQQPTYSTH